MIFKNGLVTVAAAVFLATSPVLADEKKPVDQPSVTEKSDDPFENINRFTSGFNRVVRGALVDPLVDGYQAVTPQFLQNAIGNAAANLNEPVTAVSSMLQGDTDNAGKATQRFFINSTLGLGGIDDQATEMGYLSRDEDLGQAAGYHGTESGAHIVLPILGPSNTRDLMGDVLTGLASPLPLVGKVAQQSVTYSQNQDDVNAVSKGALDPYVVERSAYETHRQFLISNGQDPGFKSTDLDVADFK
jgi:phospholipid-binding lipoprotein MlaA